MQVIPSFDPAATTSGQISVSAPNAGSKILLYNLSLVTIQLNFDNGSTALLHAGEANYWTLDGTVPQIEWTQYNVLNSVQSPSSVVTGVIYGPNERVEGTYPMSLVYSTNIGNPTGVNTNVAGSNQVTNDGNAPGTIFIESTPAGDPASAVTLTNDGILIIGNATDAGGAVHTAFYEDAGNSMYIRAGAADVINFQDHALTNQAEVSPNGIQIASGKLGKGAAADILDASDGSNLYIKAAGGTIVFQTPSGTTVAKVDSSGFNLNGTNNHITWQTGDTLDQTRAFTVNYTGGGASQ